MTQELRNAFEQLNKFFSEEEAAKADVFAKDQRVVFGNLDRTGALRYAFRMSKAENVPYVLLYDYLSDNWMCVPYAQWHSERNHALYRGATDDMRFILPHGEVLRWESACAQHTTQS